MIIPVNYKMVAWYSLQKWCTESLATLWLSIYWFAFVSFIFLFLRHKCRSIEANITVQGPVKNAVGITVFFFFFFFFIASRDLFLRTCNCQLTNAKGFETGFIDGLQQAKSCLLKWWLICSKFKWTKVAPRCFFLV